MNNFEIFTGIFGGLGLFLYGMKLMSDGLENIAGERLKGILEKITSNKIMGVLVGTIVTAVIQSSSATTVMVVSFVNAGLMSLVQATGVILGSNVGTTITAQIVSFNLEVVAPIFIGIGAILMLSSKKKKIKDIAVISVGFGILFMGMGLMSSSMKPIAELEIFKEIIIIMGRYSILGVLVGVIMTAIVQSSSATTSILVALAAAGTIDMKIAFPIVLGCNIGTCVTAIIASLTANKTAKKAALLHLLFKIFGTIIFLPLSVYVVKVVAYLTPNNLGRQVANAHTIFNIVITLVVLPISGYFVKFVNKVLPDEEEKEVCGAIYLDKKLLETPVVASTQVIKETIRMAKISRDNFQLAMKAFFYGDYENIKGVYENENIINTLEREITEYLIALSQHNLPKENAELVSEVYHTINDIERIGDHAENIVELATSKFNNNIEMSKQALKEIEEIFEATLDSLDIAIKCFSNYDISNDKVVNEVEDRIDMLEKQFRNNNIARLNSKQCYASSGVMFFDLLSNLERIGDHANNIATVRENHSYKIYS
ncbi:MULTISPECIES: Na/Pi cotransporter family protein [unclassified Clostridium]|uniref:Na/Pi cotransporter family protein n=1 Tax=Clostridium TaxID=1485 RepID=UPI001C8C7E5F|nr:MULTISPECIES: Na/Pi cotransporter family protein [unclassified Clostridium]MBX9139214.1 Na/Pi cotransporter family protein [Clostridium sp. K12(2020)]MBX9145977.1 Na/Pi cotransporter family protein [Clostridium sp. K13]